MQMNLISDLVLFSSVWIVTVRWRQQVWKSHIGCGHADLAWLGLARLGWDALPLPLSAPLGSCGGSDKKGFPDRGQIDSCVARGRLMDLGLSWEVASSNRRAPLGPLGPAKYVGFNETNCLTIQHKTKYYYSLIISFVFDEGFHLNSSRTFISPVRFYCSQSTLECWCEQLDVYGWWDRSLTRKHIVIEATWEAGTTSPPPVPRCGTR